MRVRFESKNTKTYKIISVVLAFAILVTSLGLWYNFASNTVNKAEAADLADSITVNSDFFDYYYDNQILGNAGTVNQGTTKQPYSIFNELISTTNASAQQSIKSSTINLNLSWWTTQPQYIEMIIYADTKPYRVPMYREDLSSTIWTGVINGNLAELFDGKSTFVEFEAYTLGKVVAIKGKVDAGVEFTIGNNYTMVVSDQTNNYVRVGQTDTNGTQVNLSPTNLTLPLYFGQYWINNENDNTYTEASAGAYGLTNFKWGVNLAARPSGENTKDEGVTSTPQFYAAALGIVDKEAGKNNDGTLVPKQDKISLPYFDKEWLTETKYNNKSIANIIENVNFQFDKQTVDNTIAGQSLKGDYYVFDSAAEDVYIDSEGKFTKSSDTHILDTQDKVGFFPFNSENPTDKSGLNYGFGSRFDIPFTISEYGTVNGEEEGDAVKFAFKGDDDVWVYIDGKLALDLGGAHKEAEGVIDFKDKKVYIRYAMNANTNSIKGDVGTLGITSHEYTFQELDLSDLNPDKEHTLTMFYMERGMINSNLYVQFNMAVIPNNNKLTIVDKVDASGVNSGLQAQTLSIADSDVVRYTISNKGTSKDDVDSTTVNYPTYDYIRRYNKINETYMPTVLLSGKEYDEVEVIDTNYIYIDPAWSNGSWAEADAKIYAWVWGGGEDGVLKEFAQHQIEEKVYYRIENNGYTGMHLFRYSPSNSPTDLEVYPSSDYWNSYTTNITISLTEKDINSTSSKNIFKITNWDNSGEWSTDTIKATETNKVTSDNKYLNDETSVDTTKFYPVCNTNFALNDPSTQIKNGDNWETYSGSIAGKTSSNGTFDLMYGQSATFTGQFKKDTTMQVTQDGNLYAPTVRNNETVTEFGSSGRTLGYYYTVNAPTLNSGYTVSNDGTYKYNDSSAGAKDKIHVTETYTRSIKTGTLSVTKSLSNNETSSEDFTMKLTLTTLFGSSGAVTDYSGITVSGITSQSNLNEDGTFTIKAGETAQIKGIPVGTTCKIEETDVGGSFDSEEVTITGNNNIAMTVDGNEITVNNVRKTGSLELNKVVKNGDGTTDSTNTDSFTFTAILTAPAGENVNFSNYTIKVDGQTQNFTGTTATITASVKQGTSVKISGIPYGTTYEVTEASVSEYVQDGTSYSDSNKKIDGSNDTTADTVTITNKRKTGSLKLIKSLQGGTNNSVTDDDKTKTFDFTVTLTAPNNVDLSKYPMTYTNQNGDTESFTSGSTVLVSQNKSVTISGIPYGTTYTVTETSLAEDYTQNGSPSYSDSNKKIDGSNDTTADTVTITNKKKDLSKEAYLIITKYIDSLYYNSSDNPHEFTDNSYSIVPGNNTSLDAHGYLKYTNAEQDFTFTVSKYNTNGDFIESYYVVLKFEADSSTVVSKQYNGTSYNYAVSKAFKVDPGFVYKVVETGTGTGLSWRYNFDGVESSVTGGITSSIITKGVELTYSESSSVAQKAKVIFYDSRTDASRVIESDMSSITNNLKKAA